jgi:predicted nucleic acid-binding protein
MIWLIDTNILARAAQPNHSQHLAAVEAVAAPRLRGEILRVAPQNLYEFGVPATRPLENNGLGFSLEEARAELARLQKFYDPLDETPEAYAEWKRIISTVEVKGKTGHDARLAAIMNVHGIKRILTFNVSDFVRYPGISVSPPDQVLQGHF